MRNNGFSIIEIIFGLLFLVISSYWLIIFSNDNYQQQQAAQLASQTLAYARSYANYLHDMFRGKVYLMTGNNECRIKKLFRQNDMEYLGIEELTANFVVPPLYGIERNPISNECIPTHATYLVSSLTGTNLFKQRPCLGVIRNKAGRYQAMLYWVSDLNVTDVNRLKVARLAMQKLGGKGGYIAKNGEVVSGGGWTIGLDHPFFANPQACGGAQVAPYSVVFNMDQFLEVDNSLFDDLSLQRESDFRYDTGTMYNHNTLKNDIYLGDAEAGVYHELVLSQSESISLVARGQQVTLSNAHFYANSLQAKEKFASGTPCDASRVGEIAQQNDPDPGRLGIVQGDVVCSDSSAICSPYGGRYCWVPLKGQTIQYLDSQFSGWLGHYFYCPAYAPFAQEGIANILSPIKTIFNQTPITIRYMNIIIEKFKGLQCDKAPNGDCILFYRDGNELRCNGGNRYPISALGEVADCPIIINKPLFYGEELKQNAYQAEMEQLLVANQEYYAVRGYSLDSSVVGHCNLLCTGLSKQWATQLLAIHYPPTMNYNGENYCICRTRKFDANSGLIAIVKDIWLPAVMSKIVCSSKILMTKSSY